MRRAWLLVVVLLVHSATTSVQAAPTRVTTATLTTPTLTSRVEPSYPIKELHDGVEGAVVVRFLVDPHGVPLQVSVNRSSGITAFDQAAVEAVKQWRFAPALDAQGRAKISNLLQVQLQFKIE